MPKITITKEEGNHTKKRELLAPGDYEFVIESHEFGLTQKDEDKLTFQLKEVNSGNFVWCLLMFRDDMVWKTKSLIKAVSGVDDGKEVDVNDELCKNMYGNKVWANVNIDTYNGKRKNQIVRFYNEKPSNGDDDTFE